MEENIIIRIENNMKPNYFGYLAMIIALIIVIIYSDIIIRDTPLHSYIAVISILFAVFVMIPLIYLKMLRTPYLIELEDYGIHTSCKNAKYDRDIPWNRVISVAPAYRKSFVKYLYHYLDDDFKKRKRFSVTYYAADQLNTVLENRK